MLSVDHCNVAITSETTRSYTAFVYIHSKKLDKLKATLAGPLLSRWVGFGISPFVWVFLFLCIHKLTPTFLISFDFPFPTVPSSKMRGTRCNSSFWLWMNLRPPDVDLLTCVKQLAAVGQLMDLITNLGCVWRKGRLLPLRKVTF